MGAGRILVTGASGFVGSAMVRDLAASGLDVVGALRRSAAADTLPPGRAVLAGDLGDARWASAVGGARVVVHLAARVHHMAERGDEGMAEYARVNVDGTRALLDAAGAAGVARFVFMSSVKAVGEGRAQPYTELDACEPRDAYGKTKLAAERLVLSRARELGMEPVVLRPTVVYGPGVRANILRLIHWVDRGVPLPLGAVRNQRSLVSLANLISAARACATHPAAAGETFFVDDGEPLSSAELVRLVARALGRRPRLLPAPRAALALAGRLTGRSADVERLVGSLAVDSRKIRRVLAWAPPQTTLEGLQETARWYRGQEARA